VPRGQRDGSLRRIKLFLRVYFTNIYPLSQLITSISFILSVHYMFRPLLAILRRNTTSSFIYLRKPSYHSTSVILQIYGVRLLLSIYLLYNHIMVIV
jgi:hypothetical protein